VRLEIRTSTYSLIQSLLPKPEHRKIHGVDERISLAGIAKVTEIVCAIIGRWTAGEVTPR
jgi:hypothetical protein